VELTEKQLISILEKFKIDKINTVGAKFDPNLHQAMFEVEGEKEKEGKISEVIQDGYKIGERLLRPAMVGVFKNKKSN
jgi:molecular chaperone GrpE